MKVYTLKANENWHSDRYYSEWVNNCGTLHTNNIQEADVLWLLPSWVWRSVPPHLLREKKVIATIHHIVPEKFNLSDFKQRDQFVDHYHVPCEQTKNNILKYTDKPIKVIGYWLNTELWYPQDKNEARELFNIPLDYYVIGSFQRDTEGGDLTSPKLEKGPDLFIDYLKKIKNKNLCVLLGGWRRQYVLNRLKQENIKSLYIEMAPYNILQKMYAACDLYLVCSRYEGGPQAVIEAPAMKVPIISSNVGMAPDTLNQNCVIDVVNDSYIPTHQDVEECYLKVLKYDIKHHVEKYIEFFNEVASQ